MQIKSWLPQNQSISFSLQVIPLAMMSLILQQADMIRVERVSKMSTCECVMYMCVCLESVWHTCVCECNCEHACVSECVCVCLESVWRMCVWVYIWACICEWVCGVYVCVGVSVCVLSDSNVNQAC